MPKHVCLSLLLLVFLLSHVDSVSSYYQYPSKSLQFRRGATLNTNDVYKDVGQVTAKATTQGSNIYHAAYSSLAPTPGSGFAGTMVTFDVYGFPILKNGEASLSLIWVTNDRNYNDKTANYVQAGWGIEPARYGDSKTHFFVYWTADGGRSTGCFNLECIGFVPVNGAPIIPGDVLEPNNGQTKISVKIFKNKDDGDWWVHFGYDNNTTSQVGYFPKSLFNKLADSAARIDWGGFTATYSGASSPPMGSGQWPGQKSASVQNVQYVDEHGQGYAWPTDVEAVIINNKCCQVSKFENSMFYYGGPGGCTK